MKKLALFLLFFFFRSLKPALSLSPDGLSLLSLKSAVDQPAGQSVFADWNENDTTPCSWSGVSCMNITGFPDPRVVGIAVAGKNLRGYIPSELGTLIYLRRLNLHSNNFYGSIPDQLFNATSLHSLFLYGNNLSGSLPPSICDLPRLQNLDLSNNSLSGPLPENLKNCKQLQRLILAQNKFSREIPDGIWPELDNLVQLDLSSNEFKGSIPSTIGELNTLSGTPNLSFNHLSGKLPKSLGDLPVTVSFDLRNNNLSGEIPETGSFANQGPTAFLDNPLLCGFPLQKSCKNSNITPSASQNSVPNSGESQKKGLSPGLIVLISAADAAGVALVGLIIVYIYWKKKDSSNSCSCTGKGKLGHNGKGKLCSLCSCACTGGFGNEDSELEDREKAERSGKGEGELVAIDKGFSFELDELLRASAYVLGKSGLGIVYKVVLGNGIPVAVRRLGEGGEQRYKEFAAEVQAIGKVKHPNVVKLRAYYWAPDEKLLISDFISNGNLANAMRDFFEEKKPNMKLDTSGLESVAPVWGAPNELVDGLSTVPTFELPNTTDFDGFQKEAIQMVKPAKGTTTLAFIFKEGVMVAADSRASMGGYISSESVEKIIEINPYMLGIMGDGAADCQFWHRNLGIKCRLHELANKRRISVTGASKLLANILYYFRGMGLSVRTMIAGWDETGPGLYYVDSEGRWLKGMRFSVGSGSRCAYGVLDNGYRHDMSVEEAAELARRAIYHATFDVASSTPLLFGVASVYHVGPNGWKKLSGDDVGELHIFTKVLQKGDRKRMRFYHDGGAVRVGTSHLLVANKSGGCWYFTCKSEGNNWFSISGPDWACFASNHIVVTVTLSKDEGENYHVRVG